MESEEPVKSGRSQCVSIPHNRAIHKCKMTNGIAILCAGPAAVFRIPRE